MVGQAQHMIDEVPALGIRLDRHPPYTSRSLLAAIEGKVDLCVWFHRTLSPDSDSG